MINERKNDAIAEQDRELAETKKRINKELLIEQVNAAKKLIDEITGLTKARLDERFDAINEANTKEIDETKSNIERQQELAEKGYANQLQFEKEQLVKAQQREKEELEKQERIKRRIALGEAYLAAYQARLISAETDAEVNQAGFKALQDVLVADAISRTLAAGFSDGGYTGDGGKYEAKGIVHGGS